MDDAQNNQENGKVSPSRGQEQSFMRERIRQLELLLREETARRERADAAVRESESDFRTLFNNVPVGLYRNTPGDRGKFIMANPAIIAMFGFESESEFLATSVADIYANPEKRKQFSAKLSATGRVIVEPLKLRKKNGELFWGAVTANAVRDEQGAIKFFDGIIEDITDRVRAREELERYKANLEQAVFERTAELMRANRELQSEIAERKRMQKRLGELSESIISLQEQERANLSRELHDELGQQLTALRLEFDAMKKQAPELAARGFAESLSGMVERITEELRRICKGLRPSVLDDLGLCAAIGALTRDVENRTGLALDIDLAPISEHIVPPRVAIHVYRVLQESLNNIVKHSHADRAAVRLEQRGEKLVLTVEDNGRGMDAARAESGGFGIIGMARRAELCHGRIALEPNAPHGVRVTLEIPLDPDSAPD